MKKFLLIAFLVLVGLVALVALVGAVLPRAHVATRSAHFHQPPDALWQAITNYQKFPSWRPGVKSVERMGDRNGYPAWVEDNGAGWQAQRLPIEIMEAHAPQTGGPGHLMTRIADARLPFGGTWTYEIVPTQDGSMMRITENGVISNPIYRFMARYFFGYRTTIDIYLKALGKKFGEDVPLEE
jgi:hypothetical protein